MPDRQEGVEPEKTEQAGSIEPPSVGDMEQGSNRRGSVRLNTFETMLNPTEIVSTLAQVRTFRLCSVTQLVFAGFVVIHSLPRVVSDVNLLVFVAAPTY